MLKYLLSISFTLTAFTISAVSAYAADEKFHAIESVCIEYVLEGQLMNGTMLRCHRKHGLESFEIQNTEIGIGNIKQAQSSHNITIGDKIYAIDTATNTGTITTNPMYQHFKNAISQRGESAEVIGRAFLDSMRFVPDGTTKTIENTVCNGYHSQAVGSACMTEELLILEQEMLGNKQRAIRVAIGEDGGDDNYTLWQRVDMRQGPDLSNGINLQDILKNYQQQ